MPDFNIDDFKKTWQEQDVPTKYSNSAILEMLNRKSRNYVKYVLWISVAEFLFFFGLTVFYIFHTEESNNFLRIMERLGVTKTPELKQDFTTLYNVLKITSLLVTAFFVYVFYRSYQKIHVEANLKRFILQIIGFRKTVNLFILTNVVLLVVFFVALSCFVCRTMSVQQIQLDQPTLIGFVAGILITTLLSIGLILLYYRIVYGIFMRKLGKNLQQLKDIETSKDQE